MATLKTAKVAVITGKKGKGARLTGAQKLEREEARARLRRVAPWFIRPEEIRKQAMKLMRKECTLEFTKQFGEVILLSFQIADLYEQQNALNPSLEKAQRDGSIERKITNTLDKLSRAWSTLVKLPI